MIIIYHYAVHGCGEYINDFIWTNKVIVECLSMFGKVGVNLFVLLTGYFGIDTGTKISKLVKLELETIFFSIFLLFLSYMKLGVGVLSISTIVKSVFPIIFNSYWFITAYVVLYLFIPYINKMMCVLNPEEIIRLRRIILVLWCVIPTLTLQVKDGMNYTQQIWMIATYIIGASLRLCPLSISKQKSIVIALSSIMLLIGSTIIFEFIGLKYPVVGEHSTYFRWGNTILAVAVSLGIFLIFINAKEFKCAIINKLASATIAVYLFHEHPIFSKILWNIIGCRSVEKVNILVLSTHLVLCVFSIYLMGSIIHFMFEGLYVISKKGLELMYTYVKD